MGQALAHLTGRGKKLPDGSDGYREDGAATYLHGLGVGLAVGFIANELIEFGCE